MPHDLKVELEVLDFNDSHPTRVHGKLIIYKGTPPVPSVDETIALEGYAWTVKKRQFSYFDPAVTPRQSNLGTVDANIKVTLWVDGPFDILTGDRVKP